MKNTEKYKSNVINYYVEKREILENYKYL